MLTQTRPIFYRTIYSVPETTAAVSSSTCFPEVQLEISDKNTVVNLNSGKINNSLALVDFDGKPLIQSNKNLTKNQKNLTKVVSLNQLVPVYQLVTLPSSKAQVYIQKVVGFAVSLKDSNSESINNLVADSLHVEDSDLNLLKSSTQSNISTTVMNYSELINDCLPELNDNVPTVSDLETSQFVKEIEESCDSLFRLVNTEICFIGSERVSAVVFRNYSYNTNQTCKLLNSEYPWIFNTISVLSVMRSIRKKFFNVLFIQQKLNDCILLAKFFM